VGLLLGYGVQVLEEKGREEYRSTTCRVQSVTGPFVAGDRSTQPGVQELYNCKYTVTALLTGNRTWEYPGMATETQCAEYVGKEMECYIVYDGEQVVRYGGDAAAGGQNMSIPIVLLCVGSLFGCFWLCGAYQMLQLLLKEGEPAAAGGSQVAEKVGAVAPQDDAEA